MCRIKQLFILQAIMLCLAQDESVMAHWLDTTGQFSGDWAKSVLGAQKTNEKVWSVLRHLPSPHPSFLQGKETALERLQVSLCFETPQIFDVLDTLPVESDVQPSSSLVLLTSTKTLWFQTNLKPRLIIIDNITTLLSDQLSAVTSRGK